MDLKKLKVQDLNKKELTIIQGGIGPWLVRGVIAAAVWVVDNWDDLKRGHDEYKKKHNL
jgi:lactobin A/cerein 7B family class IIb bacteriocin